METRSFLKATRRSLLTDIHAEKGYAYIAPTNRASLSSHRHPSPASVIEDGMPLPGPANALHDDIREQGRGRYSFWHEFVYFSASDNSDPRTNGRTYEIAYPKISERAKAWFLTLIKPNPPSRAANCDGQRASSETHPKFQYVPWLTGLWERAGSPLSSESVMLDFGCGEGECLDQFRREGHEVFGCDISFPERPDPRLQKYIDSGTIRKIDTKPYRIPFDPNTFDLIFSNQVFEHVMDYGEVLSELQRILKPGGLGIHVFPGRWKMRESHVYVPFSSVLKFRWWLYLWAVLGIRNEYQHGIGAAETTRRNLQYLREQTNYLSRTAIRNHVLRFFPNCRFAEEAYFYPAHKNLFRKWQFLLRPYRLWFGCTNMVVLVHQKDKQV